MSLKVYCSSFLTVAACTFDLWSTFHEHKEELLDKQYLLSSSVDKEEGDTWKLHSKNTQWKVQCMVHENNMKITISVC